MPSMGTWHHANIHKVSKSLQELAGTQQVRAANVLLVKQRCLHTGSLPHHTRSHGDLSICTRVDRAG